MPEETTMTKVPAATPQPKQFKTPETSPKLTPPKPIQTLGDRWRDADKALGNEPPKTPAPAPAPTPTPVAPAQPPAAPKPAETPKEKPLVPEFKSAATPEPPKPDAAPATTPNEPEISDQDLAHVDAKVAVNFKALRESRNTWERQAKEATAKLVELQQKQAQPTVPPDYEELKKAREELSQKVAAFELSENPLFQAAFNGKMQLNVDRIKKSIGEKGEELEAIMSMKPGEKRDKELAEFNDELEPFQQQLVTGVYLRHMELEQERQQEISNPAQTLEKIKTRQAEVAAEQRQQELNQRRAFADNELMIAGNLWEEFRPKVGDDQHNTRLAEIQGQVRKWASSEVTPEAFAKISVWAARGIASVDTETQLRQQIKTLETQISALSTAQPSPAGGGTATPSTEYDSKRPWHESAAERFRKGPPGG